MLSAVHAGYSKGEISNNLKAKFTFYSINYVDSFGVNLGVLYKEQTHPHPEGQTHLTHIVHHRKTPYHSTQKRPEQDPEVNGFVQPSHWAVADSVFLFVCAGRGVRLLRGGGGMFIAADHYATINKSDEFVLRDSVQIGEVTEEELRTYASSAQEENLTTVQNLGSHPPSSEDRKLRSVITSAMFCVVLMGTQLSKSFALVASQDINPPCSIAISDLKEEIVKEIRVVTDLIPNCDYPVLFQP
ncbi:hypothetical protein OROGR_024396 [Orobanche gracilis]